MRALLRKDAAWLTFFAASGVVIGLVAMAEGGAGLWYHPEDKFGPGSLVFHWIAATLLGLCAALFEEASRTRDYLMHRPVSAGRLFWTRQLGCGLVLFTWIVLLPLLHLGGTLLFHDGADLVEPGRLWTFWKQGTVGLAFLGIGVLSGTLVRRLTLALPVAFALSLVMLLLFGLALTDAFDIRTVGVLARWQAPLTCAIAAAFLVPAWRLDREERDLDRPISRARLGAAGGAVLLVSVGGAAFLHILQVEARRSIANQYPKVARRSDGTPVLVRQPAYKQGFEVDDRHRRVGGVVKDLPIVFEPRPAMPLYPRDDSFASRGTRSRGVRYQRIGCVFPAHCYAGSDGLVHLFFPEDDAAPAYVKHLGKEGGGRFSKRAQVLGYWAGLAHIGDPEDGAVWRYEIDRGGEAFTRMALPAGDRFLEDLSGRLNQMRWYGDAFRSPVLRGERGVYVVEKSIEPAPPEIQQAAERLAQLRRAPQPAKQMTGPVHFSVTIPASAEGPAFEHTYAPYTIAEKALSFQMHALSLLRAPLLASLSLAAPRTPPTMGNPTDDDARIFLDPMVMLGAHWLLGANLLVALALAGLAYWRLGKLGASPARRGFWCGGILLFGVAGYLVYRACENARAWQPLEGTEPVKRPLLIQSAA
jgi:hypothetical protein